MKKLVFLFAMAISIFAAKAQDPATPVQNPNAAVITFDKEVIDYGKIQQGANGDCVFKFTNKGKEPLVLKEARASCGCTVPVPPKEPIAPGKSNEIKVTYNTQRVGPFNKTITVTSNAKNETVVLTIKGEVLAAPTEVVPKDNSKSAAPTVK